MALLRCALGVCIVLSLVSRCAAAAWPRFEHHFIPNTLPLREKGIGDYGLTALADLDGDGDLDFVLGGRGVPPSRVYWFEFQAADKWVQHTVGTNYLSDVGLAAWDVDRDGHKDIICSGVWYRNPGKPRELPFERIAFGEQCGGAHDILVHDMNRDGLAARKQRRADRAALAPEHVGGGVRMLETRQFDGVVGELDADEGAAFRQAHLFHRVPRIVGDVIEAARGVALVGLAHLGVRVDGEEEARPERMRGAHQRAEIHRLGDVLRADAEIAAHHQGWNHQSLARRWQFSYGPP